jgi:hypothetical protein
MTWSVMMIRVKISSSPVQMVCSCPRSGQRPSGKTKHQRRFFLEINVLVYHRIDAKGKAFRGEIIAREPSVGDLGRAR